MTSEYVDARIANVNLRLPVYRDKQTTLELAEKVSALIGAMEEKAGRVDSQAFALQAAFSYAVELHAERAAQDGDTRELLKALDGIASKLNGLLEQAGA